MSKLTPLILAVIMLASTSLVALDLAELEQKNMIEADGRTGPDAEVNSILSPRATTTDINGEKQFTLQAGDNVEFESYISNVGDTAITEMGVTVTVYLSSGGSRGMIAKDAAGNDLSWTNGDVICDESSICPYASLAPGDLLEGGKYTMTYLGTTVVWQPITGEYIIVVSTSASGDLDPGNDFAEIPVSVVDWTDVILDLAWDSGYEMEGGTGEKLFTLSVSTGGSTAWSARSIAVELTVEGLVDSARSVDSQMDILGTNNLSEFGVYGDTVILMDGEDENNTTSASRYVIDFDNISAWQGIVVPDGSGDDGTYTVSVRLLSYVVYGQMPECTRTVTEGTGDNETTREVIDFCEVQKTDDDVAATSEDEINGMLNTYHDIGITSLSINQGYTIDNGTPISEPTATGLVNGPLNPEWSSIEATVRHLGSDISQTYDWNVTFEITNRVTGEITTTYSNQCSFGSGEMYEHTVLGIDEVDPEISSEEGTACVMFNFMPGSYDIMATVSMVNSTVTDASSRNDESSIDGIIALNNRPSVTLTLEEQVNSIVIGPGTVTLTADAFDADDQEGQSLNYVWNHPQMREDDNGTLLPSECNGQGDEFKTCRMFANQDGWAGTNTYTVTVIDEFGATAVEYMNVFIWNQKVAVNSTDLGFEMIYNLTYNGMTEFTIDIEDSDESYTKDLTEFGYAGEYTSEAVLDYEPVTSYLSDDVHMQDITINYDATEFTPTSVFYRSNGNWAQLDSTINAGTIDIDMGAGAQTLPRGEIILMGGELQIIDIPESNPTGLNVVASKGGDITASWSYNGNTVPGFDWLSLQICDSSDVCSTTKENTTLVGHSMSGQTETTHGETYTYTLSVCNVGGCNPTIATASVMADKQVDGDATATEMTVSNKADSNAWAVSWKESGDTSDVTGWMVCWTDYSWASSGAMPSTCADAGDSTTVDINHPDGQGTKSYFFTAVPYDNLSNMNNAIPGTDIMLTHENSVEDPCEIDSSGEDCTVGDTSDDAEGSIPAGAWGAIIGLVVVAFVVGAFILSRGGDGDEGKDWDY